MDRYLFRESKTDVRMALRNAEDSLNKVKQVLPSFACDVEPWSKQLAAPADVAEMVDICQDLGWPSDSLSSIQVNDYVIGLKIPADASHWHIAAKETLGVISSLNDALNKQVYGVGKSFNIGENSLRKCQFLWQGNYDERKKRVSKTAVSRSYCPHPGRR